MRFSFELRGEKLVNVANAREHHYERSTRVNRQRGDAKMHTLSQLVDRETRLGLKKWKHGEYETLKLLVTFTRLMGPRMMAFDTDGLSTAFKAIRDGLADGLGLDDRSDKYIWHYEQERAPSPGVRVSAQTAHVLELRHVDAIVNGAAYRFLRLKEHDET